ncbi:hypothetical protein [Hymenobacter sp. HDW8]|nr:hypothetical protein [Hymenobacter sp. HDW8]QIL74583.1 hypothetical protein G7064_00930 [Hymenobacter sp. HDW8]
MKILPRVFGLLSVLTFTMPLAFAQKAPSKFQRPYRGQWMPLRRLDL